MPKTVIVADNQRLDRPDFEDVAEAPASFARHGPANMLTSPDGTGMWILDGFGITSSPTTVVTVTRGVALLRQRRKGQVESGVLVSEGPSSLSVNIAAFSNGTYGVFIRAQGSDGDAANRIFWEPTTPAEFTESVMTRRAQSWGMRVQLLSPGAEWFQIGTVVIAGGVTTTLTGTRQFYFEGAESGSFAVNTKSVVASTYGAWGGGNDRNAARQTFGVKDLQTFCAAVRTQLASIIGDPWYAAITEPLDEKVSKSGDTISGNLLPNTTGRDLGASGTRWDGFFRNLDVSQVMTDLAPDTPGLSLGLGLLRWDAFLQEVDIAGDLDVTGDATVGGSFDVTGGANFNAAVAVTGTLDVAGLVFAAAGLTIGSGQALLPDNLACTLGADGAEFAEGFFGTVYADAGVIFDSGGDVGVNTLNADGVPKAWGHLTTTAGVLAVEKGWNLDGTPTVNATGITVTLDNPMSDSEYVVLVTHHHATLAKPVSVVITGASTFSIRFFNSFSGSDFYDMTANDARVSFVVFGRQ